MVCGLQSFGVAGCCHRSGGRQTLIGQSILMQTPLTRQAGSLQATERCQAAHRHPLGGSPEAQAVVWSSRRLACPPQPVLARWQSQRAAAQKGSCAPFT